MLNEGHRECILHYKYLPQIGNCSLVKNNAVAKLVDKSVWPCIVHYLMNSILRSFFVPLTSLFRDIDQTPQITFLVTEETVLYQLLF